MEWTTEGVERLILFFESHAFLYDTCSPNYHNRKKRRVAVETLAVDLGMTSELICCVINNQQ